MQNQNFEIVKYSDRHKKQLLEVWEKSVVATHHFLSQPDFTSIKAIVETIDFNLFEVYCLVEFETVLGFIGVAGSKVEMLFIDPKYIGQGLGSKLMSFAMTELKANKVDVNEQNADAVKFYKKIGFETYERTEKDDQGKDYSLLRMKLK